MLKTSRVGHTGTLDPLATGLLVILLGPATRLARFLAADEKEYIADVRLGVSTPTYDAASLAEGVRCPGADSRYPMDAELEAVLDRFRGSFLQMPPQFSAKKVDGVAAYEKARKNESVALKPVPVTVSRLDVLDASAIRHRPSGTDDGPLIRLRVAASAGFYVRSLAHDIGQALGCGAHLEALRRTRVGRFRVEDGMTLDQIEARGSESIVAVTDLLGPMPPIELTADGARRTAHGNPVGPDHTKNGDSHLFLRKTVTATVLVRLVGPDGTVAAVAEARPDGLLHPIVVLG